MVRGFFRKHPAPLPDRLSVSEALTISKAGLTPDQWRALTNTERADIRWRAGA